MAQLTLYHYWRSSCSWRVRWALAIKGVPYRAVSINLLKDEQFAPEYLKLNPSGWVPALDTGSTLLGESLAILEWIEETYASPKLLPADAAGRARVRQLALTIVAGTQPFQNLSVQRYFSPDEKKRQEDGRYFIRKGLGAFDKIAQGTAGTYCYGDSLTFADLCLIPQLYNAERFSIPLSEFPLLEKIYKKCRELPSCKAAEPTEPTQTS